LACDQSALSALTTPSEFADVLLNIIDNQAYLLNADPNFNFQQFTTESWICLQTWKNPFYSPNTIPATNPGVL